MTRKEIVNRLKLYLLDSRKVVSDGIFNALVQEAADDIAGKIALLPTNITFDVEDGVNEYDINEEADDFLMIDKEGLLFNVNDADDPKWDYLEPYTEAQMENDFPRWRDDGEGDPYRFWIKKNSLFVHPTPDADLTDGFWLYYLARPERMTDDSHYPFTGSTTEIAQFSRLGDVIIQYCLWKLSIILGKQSVEIINAQQTYINSLTEEGRLLNTNKNLYNKSEISYSRVKSIRGMLK